MNAHRARLHQSGQHQQTKPRSERKETVYILKESFPKLRFAQLGDSFSFMTRASCLPTERLTHLNFTSGRARSSMLSDCIARSYPYLSGGSTTYRHFGEDTCLTLHAVLHGQSMTCCQGLESRASTTFEEPAQDIGRKGHFWRLELRSDEILGCSTLSCTYGRRREGQRVQYGAGFKGPEAGSEDIILRRNRARLFAPRKPRQRPGAT